MHRIMLALILLWIFAPIAAASSQLSYTSRPGDWIGQGQKRSFDDSNASFRITASPDLTTLEVSVLSTDQREWLNLTLDGPAGIPLTVGEYSNASRYPFNASDATGLSVSTTGRGCNTLRGYFTIIALRFDPNGAVEHLEAQFTQMCEVFMPPLKGHVLIDKRKAPALRTGATRSVVNAR